MSPRCKLHGRLKKRMPLLNTSEDYDSAFNNPVNSFSLVLVLIKGKVTVCMLIMSYAMEFHGYMMSTLLRKSALSQFTAFLDSL